MRVLGLPSNLEQILISLHNLCVMPCLQFCWVFNWGEKFKNFKDKFLLLHCFVGEWFLSFLLWCLVNGFYIWLCSRAGWSLTHWRGFYNFILYYVCFDLLLSDAVFSFIGCFFLPLRKKLFLYQYWDLSKNLFWQPF